ncbi:ubiquitin-conjugating enzyme E2 J1-like [Dermacentor andersoni]|uniref:ubiquitin-conjugating enzyme E2 J1-like n=1 Tax=Dermacentor andersoni TaxID=34620 RepID=UPI0021551572|nr:ubiquitin-conjugating enzyme E2 J1-like [Dermacentor andersoni]
MEGQYNLRSPAVKRLMREAQELHEATEEYFAQPLDDNLFEWHFTVRGPPESEFEGGIYHGRVILPPDYPMKPPSIILLTPNGRFETNKKICLSISGHHPESWQPSWSLRTALLAIIGFMPTHGSGAIGSLDYSPQERKQLAKKSQTWSCPNCGPVAKLLKERSQEPQDIAADKEAREQAAQIMFKDASERPGVPRTAESKATEQMTMSATLPQSSDSNSKVQPSTNSEKKAASASSSAASDTPAAAQGTQSALATGSTTEDTPDIMKRRLAAARILAQRAERLAQQQQPLTALAEETGTANRTTRASSGDNLRLAYNAAIWLVGSAFVGLLIRRVFFL